MDIGVTYTNHNLGYDLLKPINDKDKKMAYLTCKKTPTLVVVDEVDYLPIALEGVYLIF